MNLKIFVQVSQRGRKTSKLLISEISCLTNTSLQNVSMSPIIRSLESYFC
ncbi:unnamed protein product [Moneuplotes crassus]|uniref:Uncharacterized protein n=1 Tax=Euplotes crassus TaxID=5936 RepID=A0AAD2CYJ3_EUPCR|nr:unnamed protein product [Moneuplotes crassus]